MTASTPPATGSNPESRRDWLRHSLQTSGAITIIEAAGALGTSEMTIRRDLAMLEALGEARRVRGGARAVRHSLFRDRSPRNAKAKTTIAEKLRPLVPAKGTIAIDSSTTMACLANLIDSAQDLLVVTNGIETFEALQGRQGIRVLLSGGERDPQTSSLVGPVAERAVAAFHFDVCFISAAAIDAVTGASEVTLEEASIVEVFAQRSSRVVLGVDSTKIGGTAPIAGLTWDRIDELVSELAPPNSRLSEFRRVTSLR